VRTLAYISLLGAALVCGCSTPQNQFRGLTLREASDTAVLITSVPPLLQDKSVSCGPACVAAVAAYWDVSFNKIAKDNTDSHYAEDYTVEELELLAVGLGLKAFKYTGSMADLEGNLRKGRPLIVMIPKPKSSLPFELSFNNVPVSNLARSDPSHWIIVIGQTQDKIVVQDPSSGRQAIGRGAFENQWKKREYTCLLLTAE